MPLYASIEKKILHLRKGVLMPFEKMSWRILEKRTSYSALCKALLRLSKKRYNAFLKMRFYALLKCVTRPFCIGLKNQFPPNSGKENALVHLINQSSLQNCT